MEGKPSPHSRKGIHHDEMAVCSGNRQNSSSQCLQHAKEYETGYPFDDDNDNCSTEYSKPVKVKDDSGTGGSRVTCESKLAYQNNSKLQRRKEQSQKSKKNTWNRCMIAAAAVLVVIVACIVGYMYLPTQDTEKEPPLVNEKSLRKEMEHIREEFPSQLANIWLEFSTGIRETAQKSPTKPSIFMLLYDTDERTTVCLAQKISNISTYFLNGVKLHPPLMIEGADLEHNETLAEDYGILLEEYCPKVEEQRSLIVHNLHKIPGTVAQIFHSFCDTVSPLVAKAIYLFTMKASGVASNVDNPTMVAEEELKKLWSDKLRESLLNPLITRITDRVMVIKPEKNMAPCES